ncbi:MAG TPA: cyclase family protein, partial [Thermomicrobiales bacterium]|nr:cyclase family protein [Thermomicrobiales bacterium]
RRVQESPMIHDLTHRLVPGIPHYPGDPGVRIERWPGEPPWQTSEVCFGTHSGTHLDAPRHFLPDGPGVGALSADRFVGTGVVLDAAGFGANEPLPASLLDALPAAFAPGWFVVVRTAWDRWWGDERYFQHPYLSPDFARALADIGAGIVGIDALNVDSTADETDHAHAALLGRGVLLVENLRGLDALRPGARYRFAFAPLAFGSGVDGSPIRALAWDFPGDASAGDSAP